MRLKIFKKFSIIIFLLLCNTTVNASCYIMGDSIAQGVAMYRKNCYSETKVGINTEQSLDYWLSKKRSEHSNIVISLGINDVGKDINTGKNLLLIRNSLGEKNVIWILPPKNEDKQKIVRKIAKIFDDYILDIDTEIGKDGIHPTLTGYSNIALTTEIFENKINNLKPIN